MPNWKELKHAYGSAEDLPGILSDLKPDPKAPAWAALWDRICHQGTTYSASPAVLPILLGAASSWDSAARAMPLALAGSIVSSPQSNLAGYETSVEALRALALDTVKARDLTRTDRIYVMQSALALEGDRLWGRKLDHLVDGEFPGSCTACRKDLFLVIGEHGFFTAVGDWVRHREVSRVEIRASEKEELPALGRWLYGVCTEANDSVLGEWVLHLFGVSQCPECNQSFEVAAAIAECES